MKIRFSNFKSFGGVHTIDLAKFNVIIGKNNAGKSSLSDLIYYYLMVQNSPDNNPLLNASLEDIVRLTTATSIQTGEEEIKVYDDTNRYHKSLEDNTDLFRGSSRGNIFEPIIVKEGWSSKDEDYHLGINPIRAYTYDSVLSPPLYTSTNNISMFYDVKRTIDYESAPGINNKDQAPIEFDQYIADTMAKNEGLDIHRNLINCGCVHLEDKLYESVDFESSYWGQSHKEYFRKQMNKRSFWLEDLIELDIFDEEIREVLKEGQNILSKGAIRKITNIRELEKLKTDLLASVQLSSLFAYIDQPIVERVSTDKGSNPVGEPETIITKKQSETILDALEKNACHKNPMTKGVHDCLSCNVCGFNTYCISDPINYRIKHYIETMQSAKEELYNTIYKSESEQRLIFHPEYTGSIFSENSPLFLRNLMLAKRKKTKNSSSASELLASFNSAEELVLKSVHRQMMGLVSTLTMSVFQEKFLEFSIDESASNIFLEWYGIKDAKIAHNHKTIELSNDNLEVSDAELRAWVKHDIFIAKTFVVGGPTFVRGSTTIPTLLYLTCANPNRNTKIIHCVRTIYPHHAILKSILLDKSVTEKSKMMIFGKNIKGIKFNGKTKKGKKDISNMVEIGCSRLLESKPDLRLVDEVDGYASRWKHNTKIGKKYNTILWGIINDYSVGNLSVFAMGGRRDSHYKAVSVPLFSSQSPYLATNYESNRDRDLEKDLFNSFIPRGWYLQNIFSSIYSRALTDDKTKINYGVFNQDDSPQHFLPFSYDVENTSWDEPPKSSFKVDLYNNVALRLRPNSKAYIYPAGAGEGKKINTLPPTVGPLFYIDHTIGANLLTVEKKAKIGSNRKNAAKKEMESQQKAFKGAINFLKDTKRDGILSYLCQESLENYRIDLNPDLGGDLIKVKTFNRILTADKNDIPYAALSILSVYSQIVRSILKDMDFGLAPMNPIAKKLINKMSKEGSSKKDIFSALAKLNLPTKDEFHSKISPALTRKVAKKYGIRQKDVNHQVLVIYLFILKTIISSFQKKTFKLLFHDYLKQVKSLSLKHHPKLETNTEMNSEYDVEIINPVVWEPKSEDGEEIALEELEKFLGPQFYNVIKKEMFGTESAPKKFHEISETQTIIDNINNSFKSIGLDFKFEIIPVFIKETTYGVNKDAKSYFSGKFRMFVTTKIDQASLIESLSMVKIEKATLKLPLNRVGDGVSALISILSRIHSNPNARIAGGTGISDQHIITIIREPENHLHPDLISKLINHLFNLSLELRPSKEFRKTKIFKQIPFSEIYQHFVIETHSEVVLRQVQASVKRYSSKIKGSKPIARVYYIDQKKDGNSVVKDLKLKKNGFLDKSVPKGFFDINTDLITDLWTTEKKKVKKSNK